MNKNRQFLETYGLDDYQLLNAMQVPAKIRMAHGNHATFVDKTFDKLLNRRPLSMHASILYKVPNI